MTFASRSRLRAALLLSVGVAAGCSRSNTYKPPPLEAMSAGTSSHAAGAPSFPVTGINSGTLTVTAVEPGAGPFSGGMTAVVRGSGFDDTAVVRIGGVAVQPGDITRDGKNRITIVVPAGMVGPADVTLTQGDDTVTLRAGYVYNALGVSPNRGSTAGGALVDLVVSSATLSDDTIVEFDGAPCTEFRLLSPQHAMCKTPAHAVGLVDVVARRASANAGDPAPLIAPNAYEFSETLSAATGGLSGGPITGTLNVTVVDDGSGTVIPKALVLIGNDPGTNRKGYTDQRGAITFSSVDLKGPVTVHVSAKCFERSSIVSFDAQNVTVFLAPILDLTCAADGNPGTGHKQLASTISGELIFPGIKEFSINSWDVVPKPKANEVRVAYIFTTQAGPDVRSNPSPDAAGAELARLVEDTAQLGDFGYKYRIVARSAGLAVYALCGLERLDTHAFTPYVMGIAHNVVTSPGDETTHIDLPMTITLDHELDLSLGGYPAPLTDGPDQFVVRAYVDLGGEGVIVRNVNGVSLDMLTRRTGNELFRIVAEPAFVDGLVNASYFVQAGYYTGEGNAPYTSHKLNGVRQLTAPVNLGPFLGIPTVVSPTNGGALPADRMLRFSLDGPPADLIMVEIYGGDGLAAWSQILPGSAREVPIPDLSTIEGQSDIAAGFINWTVTAAKIDDFRYNEFQYTYASQRYWTHTALNGFVARR